MVNEIYELKNMILNDVMETAKSQGVNRIDDKKIDMIKDLAEAEKDCWKAQYYRRVTEAMESEKQGYGTSTRQGYGGGTGSSAQTVRQGYMGYSGVLDPIREALQKADPDSREKLRKELRSM